MINKIVFEYHNGGFRPVNEFFKEVITVKENKFKYEKLYLNQEIGFDMDSKYSKGYNFELHSDSEKFKKLFIDLIDNLNLEQKACFKKVGDCDASSLKISFLEGKKIINQIVCDNSLSNSGLIESAICLQKYIPCSEEMPALIGGELGDDF